MFPLQVCWPLLLCIETVGMIALVYEGRNESPEVRDLQSNIALEVEPEQKDTSFLSAPWPFVEAKQGDCKFLTK